MHNVALLTQLAEEKNVEINVRLSSILKDIDIYERNPNYEILVQRIANSMNNELNTIKTFVRPTIQEYIALVNKDIKGVKEIDPMKEFEINYLGTNKVIQALEDRGTIFKREADLEKFYAQRFNFATIEKDVILTNLISAYPTLETELTNYFDSITSAKYEEMFQIGFTCFNVEDSPLAKAIALEPQYNDLLYFVSIVSLALNVFVPDDAKTSLDYHKFVDLYSSITLNQSMLLNSDFKRKESTNSGVIKKIDGKKIYVIKEKYFKFLEKHTVETLLGACLSQTTFFETELSEEQEATFNKAFATFKADLQREVLDKVDTVLVNSYIINFSKIVEELTNDECLSLDLNKENIKNVDIEGYIKNSISYDDLTNVKKICTEALTNLVFTTYNVKSFIEKIYYYEKKSDELGLENVTSQDLANYATLDIVIEYLMTQVDFK